MLTALQPYVTVSSRDPDHLALLWDTLVYYSDDILLTGPNEQDVEITPDTLVKHSYARE